MTTINDEQPASNAGDLVTTNPVFSHVNVVLTHQQQNVAPSRQQHASGEVGWKFFTQGLDAKIQGALDELVALLPTLQKRPSFTQAPCMQRNHLIASEVGGNEEGQDFQPTEQSLGGESPLAAIELELSLALGELRAMRKQQTLNITSSTSIRLMDVATIAWNRLHNILRQNTPATQSARVHDAQATQDDVALGRCVLGIRRLISELYLTSLHFFSPFASSRENQMTGDPKRALYAATMCLKVAKDAHRVMSTTPSGECDSGSCALSTVGDDAAEWIHRSYSILDLIGQKVLGCPSLHLLASSTQCQQPHNNRGDDVLYQRFLAVYREVVRVRFQVACKLLPTAAINSRGESVVACTLPSAGVAAMQLERWCLNNDLTSSCGGAPAAVVTVARLRELLHVSTQCSQLYAEWTSTGLLLPVSPTSSRSSQHRRSVMKELLSTLLSHFLDIAASTASVIAQQHVSAAAATRDEVCLHALDSIVQLGQLYAIDQEWSLAWPILHQFDALHDECAWRIASGGPVVRWWMTKAFAGSVDTDAAARVNLVSVGAQEDEEQQGTAVDRLADGIGIINLARKEFLYRLLAFRAASATSQPYELRGVLVAKVLEFPIVTAIGCTAVRQLLSLADGDNAAGEEVDYLTTALAASVALWSDRTPDSSEHQAMSATLLTSRVVKENTFVLVDCLLSLLNTPGRCVFGTSVRDLYLQQSALATSLLECKGPARVDDDVRGFVALTARRYLISLWTRGSSLCAADQKNLVQQGTASDALSVALRQLAPHEILVLASSFVAFGDADEGARLWRCIGRSLLQQAARDGADRVHLLRMAEDAACKSMSFHAPAERGVDGRSPLAATQLLVCDIRLAACDVKGFQAATLQLLQCEPTEDAVDAFHSLISRLAAHVDEPLQDQHSGSKDLLCSTL
jgi:hypothetical protein